MSIRAPRILVWACRGSLVLSSAWTACVIVLICADVAFRALLNSPIEGTAEIAGFSVVAVFFLQMPEAVRLGRHTRSDLLPNFLARTAPAAATALEAAANLLGALCFAFLAYIALVHGVAAWDEASVYGTQGLFTFPKWPIWLLMGLGSSLTGLVFASWFLHLYDGVAAVRPRADAAREASR